MGEPGIDYEALELGTRLPLDNPHANSVHLPTIADVKGLMAGEPDIDSAVVAGYARFTINPLVQEAVNFQQSKSKGDFGVFPVTSHTAAIELVRRFKPSSATINASHGITFLNFKPDATFLQKAKLFSKNAGNTTSSRAAEDFLVDNGLKPQEEVYVEEADQHATHESVETRIGAYAKHYAGPEAILTNTGMNAVYATMRGLLEAGKDDGRNKWVNYGWMYSDTTRLASDCNDSENVVSIDSLEELSEFMKTNGQSVAGVFLEIPTNPLVKVTDLERIKEITDAAGAPLAVDVSVGGSGVVDVSRYADVIVESLTKFASGNCDLMTGSIVTDSNSEYLEYIKKYADKPYVRDLQRFSYEYEGYAERMRATGANTIWLVEHFQSLNGIDAVYWSGTESNLESLEKVERVPGIPTGIISLALGEKYESVYDNLAVAKGPSFGSNFTLATAYKEIAHPPGMDTNEQELLDEGITNTLRISVGTEDIEELKEKFDQALKSAQA